MIPWGGFIGLVIGKLLSNKSSAKVYVVSIVLAWILYFVGLGISDDFFVRHGLSFVGGILPFFVMGEGEGEG